MNVQPQPINHLFEITYAGPASDQTEPSHIHIPRPSRANRTAVTRLPAREHFDQARFTRRTPSSASIENLLATLD